jgi:hypothetical protein
MMGIAMSSALVTPFLPDNARFALSVHWAGFDSKNAIGIGGVMRIRGNLSLTGGVAFGNDSGSVDTTGTGTIRCLVDKLIRPENRHCAWRSRIHRPI